MAAKKKVTDTKLRCPFCKHDRFIRKTTDEVEMFDTGDGIRDELIDSVSGAYKYRCAQCERDVTDVELKR